MRIQQFMTEKNDLIRRAIELGEEISSRKIWLRPEMSYMDNLDKVIVMARDLREKNLIDDGAAWNISVMLGTLLGEMIINETGYRWTINDEELPVVEDEDHNYMSPITKVYKILLDKDNEEGTARSFYEGFMTLRNYDLMSEEDQAEVTEIIHRHPGA